MPHIERRVVTGLDSFFLYDGLFAFNTLGNASGNLLAIISVTASLMILAWLHLRIYKNVFNDHLEAAFLLNLCILAAGTYHVKEIRGNQARLVYTSVGVTFILFVCILLYHMQLQIRLHTTLLWKKICSKGHDIISQNNGNDTATNTENKQRNELPSVTTIEVDACEPLLA